MAKPIIDVCCGSKMFWFDKQNPNVEFCDNRVLSKQEFYPNRYIEIKPDTVCDFTNLPFESNTFKLAVFDPPHLTQAGATSWLALKYGKLTDNWPQMLHDGFWECMRVLDDYGVLIFKWSEVQIPLKQVLKAINAEPLFGHRSGKHNNTHWLCFMKLKEMRTMAEYIERDKLIEIFKRIKDDKTDAFSILVDPLIDFINTIPFNADVQEVRHGKWMKTKAKFATSDGKSGNVVKCSECEDPSPCYFATPFCSICGAKMDKE